MIGESALVVFSGGQDSTTCLYWAKKNFKRVVALSFIYGQKHVKEVDLARDLAKEAGVEWASMDVSFISKLSTGCSLTDTSLQIEEEKPADEKSSEEKPAGEESAEEKPKDDGTVKSGD